LGYTVQQSDNSGHNAQSKSCLEQAALPEETSPRLYLYLANNPLISTRFD